MTAYRGYGPDQDEDAAEGLEPQLAAAVVDVFVYVVVLNLFVEYLPQVLSETFTLSLLTAVLLKGVLEVVVAAKNWAKARFRQAPRRSARWWRRSCSGWSCSGASSRPGGRRPGLRRPRQPRRFLLGDAADPCPAAVTGRRPQPAATSPPARIRRDPPPLPRSGEGRGPLGPSPEVKTSIVALLDGEECEHAASGTSASSS